jgi:high-affinity nickel-transport protein
MNLSELPHDLLGLALVVLMLGIKHGFDPDHLAAIDGLTRYNAQSRPRLASLAGALFAAGHGIVVVGVALGVSLLAQAWQPPHWLQSFGAWMAIGLLVLLALLNIAGVLRTPGHEAAHLVGWRSGAFGRLLNARKPAAVVGVGALFALSFDTVSLAALFALSASQFGGWRPALLLALLFMAGMLVTDGINGWWIARLVRRSDETARVASRVMALSVAGVSLLTATLAAASQTLPAAAAWTEGKAIWFSAGIVVWVFGSYVLGRRLARSRPQRRWGTRGIHAETIAR